MPKNWTTDEEKTEAISKLRELLPVGATVYTIRRYVSPSGATRSFSIVIMAGGEPVDMSWLVGLATGFKLHPKHDGLVADDAFHIVYAISRAIHPNIPNTIAPSNNGTGYTLKYRSL